MPGLTNIGNTCYGNATIQALRHQTDLALFFLQEKHTKLLEHVKPSEKTRLVNAYSELVRSLWRDEVPVVQSRPFWSEMIPAAMKAGFEQFRIPMAHDAHEFLVFLLDQLHEGLSTKAEMTIRHHPSHTDMDRAALESWKRFFSNSYSPLVEILFGLQMRTVTCDSCKKESNTWETMNMLKASVPATGTDPVQMMDILVAESEGDTIEDYHCETCPTRTKACVSQRLWRLGAWVIVVLKRNEVSGKRINTKVVIPMTTSFAPLFVKASPEQSGRSEYELFASIHHHGSARGGHYTSFARSPVTGKWAHFDDERATPVDGDPILNETTYIVMYRLIAQ